MKAILFGSIGSVVETSELQRRSFNDVFAEAGLDWCWSQQDYREMLKTAGGHKRIEAYAATRGDTVDAKALHARKSARFQETLKAADLSLRPGVAATLAFGGEAGLALGLVTSTERETVEIIAGAVHAKTAIDFDVLTWRSPDVLGKPDPAAYQLALVKLGLHSGEVVAIEDNSDGVQAAKAASVFTIGFPGENTLPGDLEAADLIAEADLDGLVRDAMRVGSEAQQ